jgi:hypothetical protein
MATKKKRSMTADEVQCYIAAAGSAYFASRPITEAVKAKEQRDQVLQWIEDVRELLRQVENYLTIEEAALPGGTVRWLLAEIKRLTG